MPASRNTSQFQFAISLSVLNHLGRNLYRNFITVLGEAISNAWDADARNVWISIDREDSWFTVVDDGTGMDADDFQEKFLKIGYSKRSKNRTKSSGGRPYIGAKGIGKLALLSCAERVSVFSKVQSGDYVGGVIDNTDLDAAITNDLYPDEYPLEELDFRLIEECDLDHGTILVFENTTDRLRNSIHHLRKLLAMSFRFILIDSSFKIHVNGEEVSVHDLADLSGSTEFVWILNGHSDDYIEACSSLKADPVSVTTALPIIGFLATVEKPRNLKISGTDERATVDLFVNGRLREKHILRHIPTQRILESYIYGHIHFDVMDTGTEDPFTSSREGVVQDDNNFRDLLECLQKEVVPAILDKWDELRLGRGQPGDDENQRKSKKERKAQELYSAARGEYDLDEDADARDQVQEWLTGLREDAEFNLSSYVDCFLSENLVRKYIDEHGLTLTKAASDEIGKWKAREAKRKSNANIGFDIRQGSDDLSYLGMDHLAESAGGKGTKGMPLSLWRDAITYKPVRNVVGHTGLLTKTAKQHLNTTYQNIKAKVRTLISTKPK